jgi:nucleoside-diphosphate-sugar epimerase
MKILITGGCGYVGSVLTESLLEAKHQIIVVDNQWFGNYLKPNPNLINIKADIRDIDSIPMKDVEVVVHLANIANDPAVDLNPTLSWEVNVLAGQQLIEKAINNGVSQFIYASSGSVYGVKEEADVTEDLSLVPISVYNKTKMVTERVLLSYKDRINVHCIRPATVCGLSPRMRLDVSVNMLAFQALKNKKITVFGGDQTRPNIHIKDMIRVYDHFINNSMIESGCYNAGFENISILEIAKLVQNKIETEITVSDSNDPRSYRQNSDKLLSTGFERKYNVETAIDEIIEAYRNGKLIETEESYTVKWMKENILK